MRKQTRIVCPPIELEVAAAFYSDYPVNVIDGSNMLKAVLALDFISRMLEVHRRVENGVACLNRKRPKKSRQGGPVELSRTEPAVPGSSFKRVWWLHSSVSDAYARGEHSTEGDLA